LAHAHNIIAKFGSVLANVLALSKHILQDTEAMILSEQKIQW